MHSTNHLYAFPTAYVNVLSAGNTKNDFALSGADATVQFTNVKTRISV